MNNVQISEIEGKNKLNKRFIFDSSRVPMNNFITELLRKYNIKDVSIKEPDIDEIIRGIYEGSINVI
jgi:ABC-2 type transport system ATP-binding protein